MARISARRKLSGWLKMTAVALVAFAGVSYEQHVNERFD